MRVANIDLIGYTTSSGEILGAVQQINRNVPGLGALSLTRLEVVIKRISDNAMQRYMYTALQATAALSLNMVTGLLERFIRQTQSALHAFEVLQSIVPMVENFTSAIVGTSGFGQWSYFVAECNHHVTFDDFVGDASFGTVGGYQFGLQSGDDYFTFDAVWRNGDYIHIYPINNGIINRRTNALTVDIPSFGLNYNIISLSAFGRLSMS